VSKRYKIVISDCHLSAGRFFEGSLNPYEDFLLDEEMASFFDYFSSGKYDLNPEGEAIRVDLIINGDYFDYLNVPLQGEFEEAITEEIALYKTDAIMKGHPKVMAALKRFASKPGKRIQYLVGNHDAELFFPKVQEKIVRAWDVNGSYPSANVEVLTNIDRIYDEAGIEIRHGNQYEAGNRMDFSEPFVTEDYPEPVLKLPWGSIYVLKIINRLKWERSYVDKVRPLKVFVLFGLILHPFFTLRFVTYTGYYFLKTRIEAIFQRRSGGWKEMLGLLKQEARLFQDLETEARDLLTDKSSVRTVIFGHTHRPMDRVYPDGKQYINTGTWTRMINLDWSGLGQNLRMTFAHVKVEEPDAATVALALAENKDPPKPHIRAELREWVGEHYPHRSFQG
jgi:UDP-2,3-diacylglucosamine pyrophosphatase LpxH